VTAPPPAAGRPFKLWWLTALLAAAWAGLALARVIPRDGPPPGTKGLPLARRVVEDLRRNHPEALAAWRPFDTLEPGGGHDPRIPDGDVLINGLFILTVEREVPGEVRAAIKALLTAWYFDLEEGRRSWAERGPEPLDPDLVAAVEKALQLP